MQSKKESLNTMNRSLYEINQDYLDILDNFEINEETGEVYFNEELLNNLETEFKDKVDNIACYIKDLQALSNAIKDEKKRLDDRLKLNDRKVETLTNYLSKSLEMRNIDKLETTRNKLSFRKSKSVNVLDESLIDNQYFKVIEEKKLDKKALLEDLKKGCEVKGAELLEKHNLQIK